MEISVILTPQSQAFIKRAIASGRTVDEVVNEALALLQRHQEAWIREKKRRGESIEEPLVYTDELLEEFRNYALAELVDAGSEEPFFRTQFPSMTEEEMIVASRQAHAEYLGSGRQGYTQSEMED